MAWKGSMALWVKKTGGEQRQENFSSLLISFPEVTPGETNAELGLERRLSDESSLRFQRARVGIHVKWLQLVNSSSRGSSTLFWPSRTLTNWLLMYRHKHIENKLFKICK